VETLDLVWLIPALPLAGFLVLLVGGRKLGEPASGWLATLMSGGAFVVTVVMFFALLSEDEHHREHVYNLFDWLHVGGLQVDVGFLLDPLSVTMALFVTGVGTLIHLYSIGYMHGDKDFSKFFVYLNLFLFSMLMLVLGSNMLITFLGWEGVGACSYLLIAFWFSKEANASAGKKAFVTNRIGDWGFMTAMFLTFATVGSLDYAVVLPQAGEIAAVTATAIALLLFVGACGKSAQIPLFVWLPDAMAGPTPVSALIHAATMVTGGVYLMTRVNPILVQGYDWAPDVIAWVGVLTALVAATIAVAQNDIKKILAYSTVSQLGYMFLAIGVGGYAAAVFHMVTHAFFKALLFLGSGSVIHGMHDEQDIRRMGNLRKYMPVTAITFCLAWLAIAGFPLFSGFWSKDEILAYTLHHNPAMWVVGILTAVITAYYMTRCVLRTFWGSEKWEVVPVPSTAEEPLAVALASADPDVRQRALAEVPDLDQTFSPEPPHSTHVGPGYQPHESPWTMTTPLVILGVLSVVGGFLSIPFGGQQYLEQWLEPSFEYSNQEILHLPAGQTLVELIIGAIVALVGIGVGWSLWSRPREAQRAVQPAVLGEAWFYDQAVSRFMGGPGRVLFEALAWFDRTVIDGAVNAVGVGTVGLAAVLRKGQTGFVRRYAFGVGFGSVILLGFVLAKVLMG
jgi:NADH-quinone oxidoreductase subunit L